MNAKTSDAAHLAKDVMPRMVAMAPGPTMIGIAGGQKRRPHRPLFDRLSR